MIDREKVLKGLEYCLISDDERKCPDECPYYERCWDDYSPIEYELKKDALELLKKQPEQKFFVDSDGKITPLPVQEHGHWIKVGIRGAVFMCSICRRCRPTQSAYCPDCGTKMDEEVKQDDRQR